jgi:rhomboid protease GluP
MKMLDKLTRFFTQKGYMRLNTSQPQMKVVMKITPAGIRYLCLIDDTQTDHPQGLLESGGSISRALESSRHFFETDERYSKYAGDCQGLAVVITDNPNATRSRIQEGEPYWLIHQPARRLMIYDDQPGEFIDARTCVEEFLNQNVLSSAFGQLRQLFSPVNTAFIVINILIFVVMELMGSTESASFMHKWGAMSVYDIVVKHEYYRLMVSAFLHFGTAHLLYNMIALLYLGKPLEQAIGSAKYLIFYLLCALGANLASLWWYWSIHEFYSVSAGASGAICGVAGGVAYVMLRNRKENKSFNFVRWAIFVALLAGQGIGDSTVDNAAHIGGMVIGFLLGMLMYHKKERNAAM